MRKCKSIKKIIFPSPCPCNFSRSKISNEQQYCEILLKFKISLFYFTVFSNVIYGEAEFSSSLLFSLQSYMIPRKSFSYTDLVLNKHLPMLKTVVLFNICVFFRICCWNFKRTAFIGILCNIFRTKSLVMWHCLFFSFVLCTYLLSIISCSCGVCELFYELSSVQCDIIKPTASDRQNCVQCF